MSRILGFLALVTLGFLALAGTSAFRMFGRHDSAPRSIDASVTSATLADGAWVTAHGHIDPDTLFRSGRLAAFRLREREDGLVFVVRVELGSPLDDEMLWKRSGIIGALVDATKKAAAERDAAPPLDAPAPISDATTAYLLGEHELTGAVFAPGVGMNTDIVRVGADDMKLTGMFGSYESATHCPSPLRAVTVGEKPPTAGGDLTATLEYLAGAMVALALLLMLLFSKRGDATVSRGGRPAVSAPRGAQIAGETCDVCNETIVVEPDGVICESCQNAVHARCLGKHARGHAKAAPYRG